MVIERDNATKEALEAAGWLVIVVWEHDDLAEATRTVTEAVVSRRNRVGSRSVSPH